MGDLRATIAANQVYDTFSLSITRSLLIYTVIAGSAWQDPERNAGNYVAAL